MHRLNRKMEYALMALRHMAGKRPGELTSAKEIVDLTGSPFDATARVLQIMAQRGLLRSEQGAHGGYVIIRDLSKVSFFELVEMIDGPVEVAKCISNSEDCELVSSCNIQTPVMQYNRKLAEFYRTLSLSEILRLKEARA